MESRKILAEVSTTIKMPKKIYVGDPMYFEEFDEDELKRLTYSKSFRGKSNWVGCITITESEDSFESGGKTVTFKDSDYTICLAPNNPLLEVYKEGNILKSHRKKQLDIGVDTACYVIGIDDRELIIDTMSDGFIGDVFELYKGSKLDGIIINLSGAEYDISDLKEKLGYLFNVKFE